MFQICQHQFLMLLLVIQTQFDQRRLLRRHVSGSEGLLHMLIDMPAVGQHLIQRRA